VIGALDELHQWFVPNRSGLDRGDWIADTLGGVFGTLLGQWVMPRLLGIAQRRAV
jgi:VanZ family protein